MLAAILLVLQIAATCVVPFADALSEASTPEVALHIEAQGSTECPTPHDPAHCQLCRAHGTSVYGSEAAQLRCGSDRAASPGHSTGHDLVAPEALFSSLIPRAPPA